MDPVSKAQNSEPSGKKKPFGRPFQKGQSGNPGGRPKKKQITEIYESILKKAKNRKQIEEIILKIILSGRMASVLTLREMAERVEGKVVQPVDVSGDINLTLEEVLAARKRAGK
jgi:hypothetical protein